MPWTAITVRVLMIIGALGGLGLAAMVWLVAATITSGNELALEFLRGVEQQEGIEISPGRASLLFTIVGLIPFVYALLSLLLAGFAGRRSRVVLWSIVAFHTVAALLMVINFLGGSETSIFLSFFALIMIVLMLTGSARGYYRKPPPNSGRYGPWQASGNPYVPLH